MSSSLSLSPAVAVASSWCFWFFSFSFLSWYFDFMWLWDERELNKTKMPKDGKWAKPTATQIIQKQPSFAYFFVAHTNELTLNSTQFYQKQSLEWVVKASAMYRMVWTIFAIWSPMLANQFINSWTKNCCSLAVDILTYALRVSITVSHWKRKKKKENVPLMVHVVSVRVHRIMISNSTSVKPQLTRLAELQRTQKNQIGAPRTISRTIYA